MKLCVVGNSHAGMIVAAHRDLGWSSDDLTVFAKPSLLPGDIVADGTVLRAGNAAMADRLAAMGTPDALDLAGFDAVLCVAMTPSVFSAAQVLQHHSVLGWPSTAMLPLESDPAVRHLISPGAYRAILLRLVADSEMVQLLHSIARPDGPPVFFAPQPYPAENILEHKGKYPLIKRLHREGDAAPLVSALEDAHRTVFAELPRVTYLEQAADTVAEDFLTRRAFTRGSVRLNIEMKHRKTDVLHANAAFGGKLLKRLSVKMQADAL
jgi:hypothetical protein